MHNNGNYYGNLDVNGTLNMGNGQFTIAPDPNKQDQNYNKPITVHVTGDFLCTSTGGGLNANVYVGGNVNASTGYTETGNLYVNGNVTLSGGYKIVGNIYTKGTVSLSGGSVVNGNIYAVKGVSNNASVTGTIDQNDPSVAAQVPAVTENITASAATIQAQSNTLTADFSKQSSYTFTQSGNLTMSNYGWVGTSGSDDGDKVILDASSQDLYISLVTPSTVSGSTITVDDQADILTNYSDKNPHNVYLYLSNNSGSQYVNLNFGSSGDNFVGDEAYYNTLFGLQNPKPRTKGSQSVYYFEWTFHHHL